MLVLHISEVVVVGSVKATSVGAVLAFCRPIHGR